MPAVPVMDVTVLVLERVLFSYRSLRQRRCNQYLHVMVHGLLSAANQQQIPVTVAAGCVVRSTPISYLYHTITAIFRPRRGTQATASKLGIAGVPRLPA